MQIIEELSNFLIEKKYIEKGQNIDATDSLIENGIIDSVGMLNLVEFIENRFSIKVDEDDLMPENFDSLKAIEDYVKSILSK